MQADFAGTSLSALSWILNAYNIVFAAFLVAAGRLADLAGRRRTFQAGVVLFTLASVACAAAPTVELLVAARVLQALGAAITRARVARARAAGLPAGAARPRRRPVDGRRGARRGPRTVGRRRARRARRLAARVPRQPPAGPRRIPRRAPGADREPRPGPPHAARSRRRGARRARDRRAHAGDRAGGGVGLDERRRARRVRRGAAARHGLRAPLPLASLADARPRPAADPHALRREPAEHRRRRGLLRLRAQQRAVPHVGVGLLGARRRPRPVRRARSSPPPWRGPPAGSPRASATARCSSWAGSSGRPGWPTWSSASACARRSSPSGCRGCSCSASGRA